MDIDPVLLELAGAEVDLMLEAESIQAAFQGESWPTREMVFAEYAREGILQGTEFVIMIRTGAWKLV